MAKAIGKEAYIVMDLNSMDTTVKKIYESIVKEYISLTDGIISPDDAFRLCSQDSLLMVVDTQNENLVFEPKLAKKARKVGVIDHHRKGIDVITGNYFLMAQTSASSSVELVVSLFEFFPAEISFNSNEANWMLLGIIVDTNNFIYRTTAKTFEVAAMLQKYGASMPEVKKYLREDISEKIIQNDFINSLEIYRDRIGLAISRDNIIYERELLAKISDEIISIAGIEAGITVAMIGEDEVGISARSLGEINVQILMEQLGGGGHLNNAAAQIKDEKIEDVVYRLKGLIDDFMNKEDAMKVILIKDVKGRGRKGEIIELLPGFANHLVRTGSAILATPENLRSLEAEKQKEIENEMKHLTEMKELKKIIEGKELKIAVRTGSNGKLFGSVSMKQVVDAFEKETGITLDKRKIIHDDNITSLGTYQVPIQLHKDVQAKIKVFVVEKE
jgi:ribosomal protein L9